MQPEAHLDGCIELKCEKMASCTEIVCDKLYAWARNTLPLDGKEKQ